MTSAQTLNECYRVLTKKRQRVAAEEARQFIRALAWTCRAPLDWATTVKAWQISDLRRYHWWDCLLLAPATRVPCSIFVTEDLPEGDEIDGMILGNPFATDLRAFFERD